ncbi:hypothetical protein N7453_011702 [Penicillium expansum]|nr:hypothetical protein N7453_011702 [Penicillium expansum]
MAVPNESSEDVNDFLQRIRELGERRDKEDDERTKKLEEEILQGRKERQARRAERARSLALTDDSSTLNIARLSASSISVRSIDPPEHLEPTPQMPQTPGPEPPIPSAVDSNQDTEASNTDKRRGSVPDFGIDSPSRTRSPLSRSRAGTLPWQQRPSSRDFNVSPGSTSPTRSPTRASHLRNLSTASDENTLSRLQFGFPRPSKDAPVLPPSPNREAESLAHSEKEEQTDSQTDVGAGHQEPEVGEESSTELDKVEALEERSSPSPGTGSRDSNMSHRFSVSSVSATGLGSPVHLSETPKLEPRQNDSSFEESVSPSPTQRRMSPERTRSTSPTKGLGGFVQSAMMRRSDSVSKRWSAQTPQGLGRSNSIVSNRSSVAGPSLSEMTPPTLGRIGREPSTLLQRPGSSHSEATTETTERPTTPADRDSVNFESPGKSFRPNHSRSASSATADGSDAQSPFVSKTMDPRRWSPNKASWLESALNRPELPRQTTRPPSQPNWAKDRQSRVSIGIPSEEIGGSGPSLPASPVKEAVPESPSGFPFKKQSISGSSLHRNSVSDTPSEFPFKRPGTAGGSAGGSPEGKLKETPPESPWDSLSKSPSARAHHSTGTLSQSFRQNSHPRGPSLDPWNPEAKLKEIVPQSPSVLGSPDAGKTKEETSASPSPVDEALNALSGGEPAEETKSASPAKIENESLELPAAEESEPQSTPTRRDPPDSLSPKPNFSISTSSRGPISPKAKPQSPVLDFRANLRKREVVKDNGDNKEPEFKNVFGRLKKTETRNYVAPDELKGNILRGKAALNNTGGPKKTERVDEFRKSLVSRKDEMKAGGGSIRRNTAGEQDAPPKQTEVVPEAIAMRQNMTRANSLKQPPVDEPMLPAKRFDSRASQDRPPLSSPTSSFKGIGTSRASQEMQPLPSPTSSFKGIGTSRASQEMQPLPSPTSSFKGIGTSRVSQETQPLSPSPANDEPGWPLKDNSSWRASQESQPLSPFPADDPIDEEPEAIPAVSDYKQIPGAVSSADLEETREAVAPIEPSIVKMQEPSVKALRPVRQWPPAPVAEATVTPGLAAKSKLAGRINPALAGLLSRGAPVGDGPKKQQSTPVSVQSDPASPSAPLTHITKGRARGPKRRLPQTTDVSTPSARDDTKEVGAISCSEATPSQTPTIPVESLDIDPEYLLQPDENPVPDIKNSRSDSPVTEQLPEMNTPPQDTPERDTPQSGFPQALQTRSLTTDFDIFPSANLETTPRDPESPGEVSPSSGPPVPPKSDPPTSPLPVTPKPQWGQQNRFASSSPSPLRTSHKENQMDSPMSRQKSIPGVIVESARSSVSRPMSHPSPPVPP